MVEETQNQQPFKRIKVEEDRISSLPDCLIIDEILSRLDSTKQAITTGVLSRRWQHLWAYVPVLVFQESERQISTFSFFRSVNKTIRQCRQTKLKKFKLILHCNFGFEESHIKSWIHYAIRCNVEEFVLDIKYQDHDSVLDHNFYSASSFTSIRLNCRIFNPSTSITWGKLKSLHISNAELDQNLIQNILSGSPLLETVKLDFCYCIWPLDITSKSVKKLVLSNLYRKVNDITVINAPNLLSITIKDREAKEEMPKGLLVSLHHVKEVNIGISCLQTLSGLKAKGFIPPSNLKLPMNEAVFFDNDLVSNSH